MRARPPGSGHRNEEYRFAEAAGRQVRHGSGRGNLGDSVAPRAGDVQIAVRAVGDAGGGVVLGKRRESRDDVSRSHPVEDTIQAVRNIKIAVVVERQSGRAV